MSADPAHRPSDLPRVILFLQGPPSGFWRQLGDACAARGARVLRVNLCLADRLFWRRRGATDYRGTLRAWPRWLRDYIRREGVTDIVYYADRLPYHRLAAAVARVEGVAVHAVEFGYLRPDWLTLEPVAGGAWSRFPADPAGLRIDAPEPDLKTRYPHDFAAEAFGEVSFALAMVMGRPLYPFYVSDRPIPPLVDYGFWLLKLARGRAAARADAAALERLRASGAPYWLTALQLPVDYQLRFSAWYPRQRDFLNAVIASFATDAPKGDRLLVKTHPLDNGMTNWRALAARLAARHGVADRVDTVSSGDLGQMMNGARGVIAANSTVGLTALRAGRPVKTLGAAVYAMPGLTDGRPLADFWVGPTPPDPATLRAFVATLAADIQIKGSFYNPDGRALAAAEMAARLTEAPATARCGPPPRAAACRAMRRALAEGRIRP
jgi:capsular polysaccharide export protein